MKIVAPKQTTDRSDIAPIVDVCWGAGMMREVLVLGHVLGLGLGRGLGLLLIEILVLVLMLAMEEKERGEGGEGEEEVDEVLVEGQHV